MYLLRIGGVFLHVITHVNVKTRQLVIDYIVSDYEL